MGTTNFTINWFEADQDDLSFLQVEVRTTWHGHATLYSVANDATSFDLPVEDGQAVHWEVRAYYFSDLNNGKLVKAGDLWGGINQRPPSNLKYFLDAMTPEGCSLAAQLSVLMVGFNPKAGSDPVTPAGYQQVSKNAAGTDWELTWLIDNSEDFPSTSFFTLTVSCLDGLYTVALIHSVYGPVGGDSGQINIPIDIDEGAHWEAGTITIQF